MLTQANRVVFFIPYSEKKHRLQTAVVKYVGPLVGERSNKIYVGLKLDEPGQGMQLV